MFVYICVYVYACVGKQIDMENEVLNSTGSGKAHTWQGALRS